MEPQIAKDQIEIRGGMESVGAENISNSTSDEVSGPETAFEPVPEEQPEAPPTTAVRTYVRTYLVHQLNCVRNRRELERHQTDST